MNTDYTHILFIGVWSNELNAVTNHGNIDTIIRERVNDYLNSGVMHNFRWRFAKLSEQRKSILPNAYIVNIPFNNNEMVLDLLRNMFNYIETNLKNEGKIDYNSEIIYNVFTPVKV